MTTSQRTFADDPVDTEADANDETLTGFVFGTHVSFPWAAKIITGEGGSIGGQSVQIYDKFVNGQAGVNWLRDSTIGVVADNTATEVLVKFKVEGTITQDYGFHVARLRSVAGSNAVCVALVQASATTFQLWYIFAGSLWTQIGGTITPSGMAGDEWWWARVKVTSGHAWSVRVWEDGTSEPGTWSIDAVTDSNRIGGSVGFGGDHPTDEPYFWDYWAVGTAGDAPPEPPAGGPVGPPSLIKEIWRGIGA
jgi:hypothetical protein